MSFILVLISLMLALDLVWWGLTDHVARRSRHRRFWRVMVGVFAVLQFGVLLGVLVSRLFSERVDEMLGALVMSAVFIWHFIGLPLFLIAMLAFGIKRCVAGSNRVVRGPGQPGGEAKDAADASVSRRGFLVSAMTIPPVFTLAATGYSLRQQSEFRIRPFEVRFPRLPKALDGLTIAHVSDTHVGGFTRGTVLEKIIEETNNLNADLVLFTGDLINHALLDLPHAVDMLLKVRYREAMYLCEGNHDLIEDRFAFEQYARDRRLPILINESATITIRQQPIQLLGLRWGGPGTRAPRAREHGDIMIAQSMDAMLPQLNPQAFQILLAHHPHAFDPAAKLQIPLTLSGHTHGGQLMLTDNFGFGPAMYRYWSGLYEKNDSKLLVSNGVGNWFPLRVNAPAEILHLTLRASEV